MQSIDYTEGLRARHYDAARMGVALSEARGRMIATVADLSEAQVRVPYQAGVNPILWELGHVAHFAELWTLRGPHRTGDDGFIYAAQPPVVLGPDAVFDSARLAHSDRWHIDLPSRAGMIDQLGRSLEVVREALDRTSDDDAGLYFHRLALFHEDMHCEAFCWLRARLGYPPPSGIAMPHISARDPVRCDGGRTRLGWPEGGGFAFDNELPSAEVVLEPFEIDATCVSAGAFERFVDAGGYDDPVYWPGIAGEWRKQVARSHPERWRHVGGQWEVRWFDRWLPLDPSAPVVHVSAYEAQAYALWCGRRLPSAAEWEHAAIAGVIDWGGTVWEWASDPFLPYPGFDRGPYRDYSAPWFETHREMRGGAYVSHPRMHHPRYRNFFMPHRTDVFGGVRTARTIAA